MKSLEGLRKGLDLSQALEGLNKAPKCFIEVHEGLVKALEGLIKAAFMRRPLTM